MALNKEQLRMVRYIQRDIKTAKAKMDKLMQEAQHRHEQDFRLLASKLTDIDSLCNNVVVKTEVASKDRLPTATSPVEDE